MKTFNRLSSFSSRLPGMRNRTGARESFLRVYILSNNELSWAEKGLEKGVRLILTVSYIIIPISLSQHAKRQTFI